jgi:hypothetical protein
MRYSLGSFMTARYGSASSSLLTGIVGYWKLDESAGPTVADSSGNGNTGTEQGDVGTKVTYNLSGIVNTSVQTNSATVGFSRIDMGDPVSLRLGNTGSVALWVNVQTGSSGLAGFVSKMNFNTDRNGYGVGISSAHPYFELAGAAGVDFLTASDTTMTVDGTVWYHIVFTWDGSTIKAYTNGTIDSHTTAQTQTATSTGINFVFGRHWNGTDYANFGLQGKLDEIGVWSRAITAGEVTTLYNGGSGKSYPF